VLRRFLTPKWVVRHVLAVVLAVACLRLGMWQWTVYHGVHGGFQNLGYALQWPLFAGAVVWVWVRLVRWEVHPPERQDPMTAPRMAPEVRPADSPEGAAPHAQSQTLPEDAHTRYNRYLRSLAEQDERP
jgi:DNA-binding transcriptional regulator of glucitol operon